MSSENKLSSPLRCKGGQFDYERDQQRLQWDYERSLELDRYQRTTLAELQVELDEVVETARALDVERSRMFHTATDDQLAANEIATSEQYRELAKRFRISRQRVKILGARLASNELRNTLNRMLSLAYTLAETPPGLLVLQARDGHLRPDPSHEMADLGVRTNIKIGEMLRLNDLLA